MNELPPCVLPRRRFARRFLAVCLGLQVVGFGIASARFGKFEVNVPEGAAFFAEGLLMFLFYALLLVPARTSSITLVQMCALVFPLGSALMACLCCWTSHVEDNMSLLAYGMAVVVFVVLFIYLYPVMFVLGLLAHWWRKRMNPQ